MGKAKQQTARGDNANRAAPSAQSAELVQALNTQQHIESCMIFRDI